MKNDLICQRLESRLLLSAGELDTSFGNQGIASITPYSEWNAIAPLPDGGFVVAGNTFKSTGSSSKNSRDAAIIVARYSADGAIDSSFGSAGIDTFDFGSGADEAEHVMVRSDGRIVIGGKCNGIESTIRLTTNGALDTTFAKNGILSGFLASVMQPDGDLIGPDGFLIQRRSPRAGLVDSSFGDAGSVSFLTSVSGFHSDSSPAFLLQPDGDILLAASFSDASGSQFDFILTRLLPSGQTDDSFATNGEYINPTGPDIISLAVGPGGNTLVSESYLYGDTGSLFELTSSGNAVNSFVPDFDPYIPLVGLTVNADGRIDLLYQYAGESEIDQLMPDGSTDIRFDAGNIFSLPGAGFAIATQSQDHLVVTGAEQVYGVITEAPNEQIERIPNGAHVVIYGTSSADKITVTRTAKSFTFSINGISQTYQQDHVNNIAVYADAGNDTISIDGHGTNISVEAGDGNDSVKILSGNRAFVDGGNGNDSISGAGIDAEYTGGLDAYGDAGNDSIIGSRFDDNIEGDSGNDTLDGDGNMNDGLFGGSGNDLLLNTGYHTRGQAGNDTLVGMGDGGPGNDT